MVFGLCLSSAGQHERALGELQAALNLNPSFALGHIVFGWALLRAGHFDEALVEIGNSDKGLARRVQAEKIAS